MAFVERLDPRSGGRPSPLSRATRPGTRRTGAPATGRRRRGPRAGEAGGAAGASLDSSKYLLATSVSNPLDSTTCETLSERPAQFPPGQTVAEWLKLTETKDDRKARKIVYQQRLLKSLRWLVRSGWLFDHYDKKEAERREAMYESMANRLGACQSQWLGFKPSCCNGRAVAVPIGCNHRLCPLCSAHRAEAYRDRVRQLFGKLRMPWFLTLTIPNFAAGTLRKKSFSDLRRKVRRFIKIYEGYITGGVYSLETTWNREEKSWHLHCHILFDAAFSIPAKRDVFIRIKREMEFTWLRMTGGSGWKIKDFEYWFAQTSQPQTKEWNAVNRRVIDIRPVRNRDKAAYEVLKYITKVSDFADDPIAVDEFLIAVRGVRLLQTFGTWYGFKFDQQEEPTAGLSCDCGANQWRSIGRFSIDAVELLPSGCYVIRRECEPGGYRDGPQRACHSSGEV